MSHPRIGVWCRLVVCMLSGLAPWSTLNAGVITFVDDRAGFSAAIRGQTSVRDSAGAFATDPQAGSYAVVRRRGQLGGVPLEYALYDIDFSVNPVGQLQPGRIGGDIADLDTVFVEQPASQGGAIGTATWGLDSASGSSRSRNALLVDFATTLTAAGVHHFGVDLHDFETSAQTPGELRVYDDGRLLFSQAFHWGSQTGNGESHFVGVTSDQGFDQVAIVIGDDAGTGYTERWAADGFQFGRVSAVASVPEPASLSMLVTAAALGSLLWFRRWRTLASRNRFSNRVRPA